MTKVDEGYSPEEIAPIITAFKFKPDETWWVDNNFLGISNEPMTDDEFDEYMGVPIGFTRARRESESFKQAINYYT